MSSANPHETRIFRALLLAFVLGLAAAVALTTASTEVDAKKKSSSKVKRPVISKVSPRKDVYVGKKLTIRGKNFVKTKKVKKGKKRKTTLVVIFRRIGSTRQFTARGYATSTTRATIVVPDVTGDLVRATQTEGGPLDNLFRMRAITKYGAAKKWTSISQSPIIVQQSGVPIVANRGPNGDCDNDGIRNADDPDDDNDLLDDVTERSIGTDICNPDTDGDDASDYYEWRVAYEYNGGPVLPYPGLRPYPNPLVADSGFDFDGDGLTTHGEYRAWQYTGKMSRFYSDANQDSDGDGKLDGAEDEDGDLLPNLTELIAFQGGDPTRDLNWLKTDTDGDGLCDGLDDQDHDGPPTPLWAADCTTPVPNNGPLGFPPTQALDSVPGGDPDPGRIDGDDNQYSNFYEWYLGGADPESPGYSYEPCMPSSYPVSPYCPGPWNPLPTPGP